MKDPHRRVGQDRLTLPWCQSLATPGPMRASRLSISRIAFQWSPTCSCELTAIRSRFRQDFASSIRGGGLPSAHRVRRASRELASEYPCLLRCSYGGSPASIRASVNDAVSSRAQPTLLNCLLILNEGCNSSTRATAVLASSRRESFARGAASST